MQALCGVYGLRFNKRYERRGHLFGSRYMSVAITSDAHLLEAHRYVARNPVRAGLCSQPGDWRWGSYRAILDLEGAFSFLDVGGVLRLLDDRHHGFPRRGRDPLVHGDLLGEELGHLRAVLVRVRHRRLDEDLVPGPRDPRPERGQDVREVLDVACTSGWTRRPS